MTLTLRGSVPSKKNNWSPRRGGGIFLDSASQAEINGLILQARTQWDGPQPLEHPEMAFQFFVKSRRADRDNKLSTILDVLQKAGVIRNDNIAHFNGTVTMRPAVLTNSDERTVIEIS